MSGSAGIYLEQAILGHTLGFAPMPAVTTVYVALCLAGPATPPTEVIHGIEVTGLGYARVLAPFALAASQANLAANVSSVEFDDAGAAWGNIGYFELWDSATGGNRLYWGQLLDPVAGTPVTVTVVAGDIVRFSAGALAVQAATGTGGTTSPGAYLPLIGGTLSGPLTLAADPTLPLVAATKQYVDGRLSSGIASTAIVNVLNHGAYGDGVHDDTAAIQNTMAAYAGKAVVFIPDTGNSYMCFPLAPPTGTDLLINGTLKLQSSSPNSLVVVQNVSSVAIRGHGTLDGNGANQSTAGVATLEVFQSANVQISGLTIQNAYNFNLNVVASTRVLVNGVTITGGNSSPEFAQGSTDCWLTNSYINGPANDGGFAFYGGVTNSGAIGNVFTNAAEYGCSVVNDPAQPAPCTDIIISNNIVYNNGFTGIAVIDSGGSSTHQRITISGNVLHGNNTGNSAFASGAIQACDIWVNGSSEVMVSGNKMMGCGGGSQGGYGIILGGYGYPAPYGVTIIGNNISNEGQGTTTGVGIYLAGAGSDILISGNHIYDGQTTKTMLHGIAGTCGGRNSIIGNHFGALGGTGVTVTSQPDSVIANTASAGNEYIYGPNTVLALQQPQMYLSANGPRWFVGQDGSTESGSNTGSNYEIISCNDGGTPLVNTLSINRATGVVTLAVAPKFTNLPPNYANDAAAAAAGLQIGGIYRNGSVMQVRVT